MMKRTVAVLMAMVMLVSTFVMLGTEAAAQEAKEGIFTYVIEGGSAKIVDVDEGATGTVELPATLGGYPVTTVGKDAFLGCRSFDTLIIPSNITKLERHAFTGCYGVTNIVVPSSIKSCGAGYIFSECKNLYSITIPKSLTDFGDFCFDECPNLTDIWYEGTEADRANITIHYANSPLVNAKWHYNSCPGDHTIASTTEVQKATCAQLGLKKGTCSACKQEVTIASAPLPHKIESYTVQTKVTCKRSGSELGVCADCGYEDLRLLPALGHAFGEAVVTKEATTTEAGLQTKTCSTCNYTLEEEIPKLEDNTASSGDSNSTQEPSTTPQEPNATPQDPNTTKDPESEIPTGLIIGIVAAVIAVGAVVAVVVIKKRKA